MKLLGVPERVAPAENATGGEVFPRWLAGDDGALVVALRRENAAGVNEG
jgi:hypothetical protein